METVQMIALTGVALSILALSVCMFRTVLLGRKCAAGGVVCVPQHKRSANYTIAATIFLIIAIETFSQLSTTHMTGTWVFMLHMFFAVPFLALMLVLRFWADGVHRKKIHRPMAYASAFCFIGVLSTGIYMLGSM